MSNEIKYNHEVISMFSLSHTHSDNALLQHTPPESRHSLSSDLRSVFTLCAVHCGSIRQTATILTMNRDCLRTGDKATVHFRFIKTPEYLHVDQRLVFREGRTKAVGTITKVLTPHTQRTAQRLRL